MLPDETAPGMPCVVQFPHPGRERLPRPLEAGNQLPWNTGEHGRKFLMADADCSADGLGWRQETVGFWGEWEPPSAVAAVLAPGPGLPRALQRPSWSRPGTDDGWRQNTDPFVFGDQFLYSNCRQYQNVKLRCLAAGSLVLFGSKVDGRFVLDTVLVVATREDYRPSDGIDGPAFLEPLIVGPLATSEVDASRAYRLYTGATPTAPVHGSYSFVPCLPVPEEGHGFPRPALDLGELLNHNLAMQVRTTYMPPEDVHQVWQRVVNQVLDAGLHLGANLTLPPERPERP